jgi:hypothetical protein
MLGRSGGGDSARERKGTSERDGRFGGQRITGMSEPATTAPSPAGAGSPTDDVLRWGGRQMVEEGATVQRGGDGRMEPPTARGKNVLWWGGGGATRGGEGAAGGECAEVQGER